MVLVLDSEGADQCRPFLVCLEFCPDASQSPRGSPATTERMIWKMTRDGDYGITPVFRDTHNGSKANRILLPSSSCRSIIILPQQG